MIDEFTGKILADKYEVEDLIQENEFGNTYRGTHLSMEKSVRIKILSPALAVDENIVERFSNEARTISKLSHPNILNVTDFGTDSENNVFIVTEDAEGVSLKDAIKREGFFKVERAVRIARQIAAALSAAHANNIVHQTLTSDKILLMPMANELELVKVLGIGSFENNEAIDFTESKEFDDLAYLSPEQCTQESEADERSDIYSLGIIFYEMLTGEVPFTADTATDLMMKHSQTPPPPLVAFRDDVPDEIEPILLSALAKNPDKRYQSAAAFADDLSVAANMEDDVETLVIPKVETAKAGAGRVGFWKTAFIVLAGISVLSIGLIYATSLKGTEPTTIVQTDKNAKPVQPINPATGLSEQNLPNMDQFPSNSLTTMDPSMLPPDLGGTGGEIVTDGGGGYGNPWENGGAPPTGAPIGQGGETITLSDGSIFMPNEDGSGVYLVPIPATPTPEPTKKEDKKSDKGTKTDEPKTDVKPTPSDQPKTDVKTDTKPTEQPKTDSQPKKTDETPSKKEPKPSSKNQNIKSGVEQDS